MKLALFVAAVVLALAQGSHAQAAPDLQTLTQYLEQIKNRMTEELNTLMNNPTLQEHTETIRAHMQPLATQMTEKMETEIKPMFTELQQQMTAFIQRLTENAKPVSN